MFQIIMAAYGSALGRRLFSRAVEDRAVRFGETGRPDYVAAALADINSDDRVSQEAS